MKKLKIIAMLILLTVFATSCKKETGPTGPAGPAGPAGTANVIYSPWIAFDGANWSAATMEYGNNIRTYNDSVPEITQNIIDGGAVLVYFKLYGLGYPMPLPFTYNGLTTPGINQHFSYRLLEKVLSLVLYNLDNTDDPGFIDNTPPPGNFYRYVIIPGGVLSSIGAKNLKEMSYEQVCNKLNMPR